MPDFHLEDELFAKGVWPVAGIDEAGRGPLAGPVAAAAVILQRGHEGFAGLDDSKKLTAARRETLYEAITTDPSVQWSCATASCEEIDELNILRATHLAMERAAMALKLRPAHCLIDGLAVRGFPLPHDGVVKGDGISISIAAASIVAKVTRDRLMRELDAEWPQYGFAKHQGYGTKVHLEALRTHGPCPQHRRSFRPVAQLSLPFDGC